MTYYSIYKFESHPKAELGPWRLPERENTMPRPKKDPTAEQPSPKAQAEGLVTHILRTIDRLEAPLRAVGADKAKPEVRSATLKKVSDAVIDALAGLESKLSRPPETANKEFRF
jgi:hypothetical protein